MISVDVKSKTAPSSPINLSTPDEEPTLSFSELLKGVKLPKADDKLIQNGAIVLALEDAKVSTLTLSKDEKSTSKVDSLLSLLKNEDKIMTKVKDEPLELNPKITESLTPKELKVLINEAKEYLKSKILQSDGYKNAQIEELPKTLKGLATLAKKYDIDISKITLQEVQTKDISNIKSPLEKAIIGTEPKVENKHEVKTDVKEQKVELKTDVKEQKVELKTDVKEQKVELKTDVKEDKLNLKEQKQELKTEQILAPKEVKAKDIQSTPLFKAQAPVIHTTTEQIVQTKTMSQTPVVVKTPKEKADETLKLLLRGEKPASNSSFTADFSVETAKVIAPRATTDGQKSLESLLRGDNSNDDDNITLSKSDISKTLDADDFEVKLKEAKQMVKYLSSDVKTAIEDYKSPFTKIKVQLNPKNMGEIDLTVVQRGKNLHVNISSNNAAVNTLSMNINELKVQLSNNGINNASFNFNSNSQNSDQQASQQNRENNKQANEEYNYFEGEETNEEILSSLEIVVPQYG